MLFKLRADSMAQMPLAKSFWSSLNSFDPALKPPADNSVGSASGDRIHLQWWTSPDGQHFAAQVLDTAAHSLWETFAIPTPTGDTVAGLRACWSANAADTGSPLRAQWEADLSQMGLEPLLFARHPTFMDIVAAGTNPAGVSVVRDDRAQIESLQADVSYWSGLAKALEKARAQQQASQATMGSTTPAKTPQGLNPEPKEANEAKREWRMRDIDVWAAQNTERIIILPRAISATKRSPYESPDVLFACLELLAHDYRLVKTGQADRNAFKEKAAAMGLAFGGSVEPSVAGMQGDQYFIRWRGSRRFLDQHLAKGTTRDPRFCLRIYFTFCETDKKVIVGSMPAHLDTSSS